MLVKNISIFVVAIAAVFYSSLANAEVEGVVEITKDNDISITATPEGDAVIYGLNGGNLTISGSDTVVTQNLPAHNTMAGLDFGNYWPWIEGTVTVENGAKLTSNTQLFRGSGVGEETKKLRKLVVKSGASVKFESGGQRVDIISLQNSPVDNAWIVVEGEGSRLSLPKDTYLANKSSRPAHRGKLEVLNGALVEGENLYVGYRTGDAVLIVDGGTLSFRGGISFYKDNREWPTSIVTFRNCIVEVPFYRVYYPYLNNKSSATFDGALFKPIGTPATKFIDASPTGDPLCPHILTGGGLIVDAPENISLEVSAKFQGDGGFTKRGDGTVVLSAENTYTGNTIVESGTLELSGSVVGSIIVSSGAKIGLKSKHISNPIHLMNGSVVEIVGVGCEIESVEDEGCEIVVTGASEWPRDTPILTSPNVAFLEKAAMWLNKNPASQFPVQQVHLEQC